MNDQSRQKETDIAAFPGAQDALKKQIFNVVEGLFVNGMGQHAQRLVLTDAHGRDLGGWGRLAINDRIETAIYAAFALGVRAQQDRLEKLRDELEAEADQENAGEAWALRHAAQKIDELLKPVSVSGTPAGEK